MRRGGRRQGAGRKPVLPDETARLWIGSRCEELWRSAHHKALKTAVESKTATVQAEYAKARAIPVPERAKWLKSHAGLTYLEDVAFAIAEQENLPADGEDEEAPGALVHVSVPRLKGERKRIIKAVAIESAERFETHVSERLVASHWAEFRKLEQALRGTPDD